MYSRTEIIAFLGVMKDEHDANPKANEIRDMSTQLIDMLEGYFVVNDMVMAAVSDDDPKSFDGIPIDDPRLENCHDAVFGLVVIRYSLNCLKIPIIQARNWGSFARFYTKFVLAS